MAIRAKYWYEVAQETGFDTVETLKACISEETTKKLHLRKGQRKLTPKQVQLILSDVGAG